jgi:uncharacterized membrane protein
MHLRSYRERVFQVLLLEITGILIASPLYAATFDAGHAQSYKLIICLSLAATAFAPIYNHLFDVIDLRLNGRVASDRPAGLRAVHAVGQEVLVLAVTLPIVMTVTGLGLGMAMVIEMGVTAFYVAYVWLFYLVYDRLRPVSGKPSPWIYIAS